MLRSLSRLLISSKGGKVPMWVSYLPHDIGSLVRFVLLALVTGTIAALLIRLSQCLPQYGSRRKKKIKSFNLRTMIIFGSGGHTTEMLLLVKKLPWIRFGPVHCVLAKTDHTSQSKAEAAKLDLLANCQWHTISRSREVKQSWITTVFTTLWSVVDAFGLVWRIRPGLIICNGPGTCVPICFVAFLYKLLGILDVTLVFVESFCRVQHLSITGRLLYYIADKFIVQWPGLMRGYPRAEYLGDFVVPAEGRGSDTDEEDEDDR